MKYAVRKKKSELFTVEQSLHDAMRRGSSQMSSERIVDVFVSR